MAEQETRLPIEGRWNAQNPAKAFLAFGPIAGEDATGPFVTPGAGSLTGSDGCNGVGGSYRPDGDTATIRRGPSTLRACPGVDTWLSKTQSVRVDGDTLHVFNGQGEEIGTLTRAAED